MYINLLTKLSTEMLYRDLFCMLSVGRSAGNIGIMFICEVALGKEHHIGVGDHTLKAAPKGYDSIVAKGRTEPGRSLCSHQSL